MYWRVSQTLIFVLLSLFSTASVAEINDWALCSAPSFAVDDELDAGDGKQNVIADHVQYSDIDKKAVATGNVVFSDSDLTMTSDRIDYWVDSDTAKAQNIRYRFESQHVNGKAKLVERVAEDVVVLERATYTTCNPDDKDWELKAKRVTLDRNKGQGTARDVKVKFQGIPFLYTPWLSFPIDDRRKSGLLIPTLGRSSESGAEVRLPWYWNIAPNRDAIIAPRFLSKRGVQLQTAARYLNRNSFGEVNLEFLNDKESDTKNNRYLISAKHKQSFTDKLRTDLLYNKVSDDQYFEDLGDGLGITSTQRLERRGDLGYYAENWTGRVRVRQFQVVDDEIDNVDEPYQQLPQLLLTSLHEDLWAGFAISSESEWTYFDHDDRVEGSRLSLELEVSRPFIRPGYFVIPSARWMHASYDLSNLGADFSNDKPDRALPSFSVDSGLVFERSTRNPSIRQTLEPRLFYLYTPEREQDDIPIFDTNEFDFSFGQLFREDRFTNPDRVADANQLTFAMSSRFLNNNTGDELLRASIGQIFYFRDQDVTLPNQPRLDDQRSDLAGELAIRFNDRWNAIAAALWDPQDDQVQRATTRIQYQSANQFILNLGYRFRREDIRQTDVSLIWPINQNWRAVGRWNRDLRDQRNLELLGGIEYDSCCWRLRFAGRRFNNDTDGNYNNSIEIQLTLKGLGTIGSPLTQLLERSIRGYEDSSAFTQ